MSKAVPARSANYRKGQRMRGCINAAQQLLLGLTFALASCGEGGAAAQTEVKGGRSPTDLTPVAPATIAAARPLSESDRISLGMADAACRSEDKAEFFDAFIRSRAVQRKYMAHTIRVSVLGASGEALSVSKIAAADYAGSPIVMHDYYRKAAEPLRAGDLDEYVMISINQSQSNQVSVEWTRVHFDGKSDGGDDLGNAFDLDGQPYEQGGRSDGQLLFEPTPECWQLVADIRYRRGATE